MTRGRRPLSPEVKALKGNPGKRKLALDHIGGRASAARPQQFIAAPPDYLTQDGERDAFRMALESLPANVARRSDIHAIARWATWLHAWVQSKLKLDNHAHWYESTSKHGTFLREHPIAKLMHQAEAHLVTLEDRLGLNIVTRNSIVHRLFQMPPPPAFNENGDEAKPAQTEKPADDASPLGYLQQAGRLHS